MLTPLEIEQIATNHYFMYGETSYEDIVAAIKEAISLYEDKLLKEILDENN